VVDRSTPAKRALGRPDATREAGDAHAPVPKRKRLDQVRDAIRTRHYSYRTEEAYVGWIKRFILFHGKRHPAEMGAAEVSALLSSLATASHVSASTQNQALAALLFLYREVLAQDFGWLNDLVRAKRTPRLPVVLSREEVKAILGALRGREWLMVMLLYGAGLRLQVCLSLRVKDIDLGRNEVTVREGKGGKDRRTMLPAAAREPLRAHLARSRRPTRTGCAKASQRCTSPMRWRASIPMRQRSGPGNGCSRLRSCAAIRARACAPAFICTNRCCSVP
jgi:integrase